MFMTSSLFICSLISFYEIILLVLILFFLGKNAAYTFQSLDKAYFETVEQPTIVIQRSISCHHSGFSGSVDNHIFVVCVVSAVDYR